MTVVKSSIVSKSKQPKKKLKSSGIIDVFSNSQLNCGISKDPPNQIENDSVDSMSEDEDSQTPK